MHNPVHIACVIDKILNVIMILIILTGGFLRLFVMFFRNRYLNENGFSIEAMGIFPYHISHYNKKGGRLIRISDTLGVLAFILLVALIFV